MVGSKKGTENRGRFKPGHKSKGGRPPVGRERSYQQAFREAVTMTDWKAIIKQAVRDAKDGDKDARKWLSDNLVGTPVQRIATTDPLGNANAYAELTDDELMSVATKVVHKLGVVR